VLADTNEITFASYLVQTPSNISRLDLGTGQATTVNVNPPIGNAGGASSYNGQVTRSQNSPLVTIGLFKSYLAQPWSCCECNGYVMVYLGFVRLYLAHFEMRSMMQTHLESSLLTPILETVPFWQITFLE